jgi:hypothetical protein
LAFGDLVKRAPLRLHPHVGIARKHSQGVRPRIYWICAAAVAGFWRFFNSCARAAIRF